MTGCRIVDFPIIDAAAFFRVFCTFQSPQKQLYPRNSNRAMIIRPTSRLWAISMISMPIAMRRATSPMIFFMMPQTSWYHSIICAPGAENVNPQALPWNAPLPRNALLPFLPPGTRCPPPPRRRFLPSRPCRPSSWTW